MIIKKKVPISYIFNELKTPLVFVSLIAIVTGILPIYFSTFLSEIPISIATTLGVAISILLSYMINQSYERWWEARKIWGSIVNDSRTFTLQLQMYLDKDDRHIKELSYTQIAWNYALGHSLRKIKATDELEKWLTPDEYALLQKSENIPYQLLSIQSLKLRQLFLDDKLDKFSQIQLENTLARLTISMGKCERIKHTTFPPIYRLGLHVTIYMFVIFLSLSVAFSLQHFILQFFILMIVSSVFFFLEKAAFRLQDPFENKPSDTPMTSIAENIEHNVMEILGEDRSPSIPQESSFFIL